MLHEARTDLSMYGSGYVLLAFIRADLVERWHWLTETQLLDAIAVGQVTPGPVFTTATFVGYVLGGTRGALVATLGIFLPAFFFVAVSGPLVPRIRKSAIAGAVLDGVNVAALALMAVVSYQLGPRRTGRRDDNRAGCNQRSQSLSLSRKFRLVGFGGRDYWFASV
jgi:putative chromate ion transporter